MQCLEPLWRRGPHSTTDTGTRPRLSFDKIRGFCGAMELARNAFIGRIYYFNLLAYMKKLFMPIKMVPLSHLTYEKHRRNEEKHEGKIKPPESILGQLLLNSGALTKVFTLYHRHRYTPRIILRQDQMFMWLYLTKSTCWHLWRSFFMKIKMVQLSHLTYERLRRNEEKHDGQKRPPDSILERLLLYSRALTKVFTLYHRYGYTPTIILRQDQKFMWLYLTKSTCWHLWRSFFMKIKMVQLSHLTYERLRRNEEKHDGQKRPPDSILGLPLLYFGADLTLFGGGPYFNSGHLLLHLGAALTPFWGCHIFPPGCPLLKYLHYTTDTGTRPRLSFAKTMSICGFMEFARNIWIGMVH